MIFQNLLRITASYKFNIITIIFFELLFIIKGYRGNKLNFTGTKKMSDNIPCPYYFLFKIKKILKKNEFTRFLDLGCGSGRTIDFFNKNFKNKEFIGIEFFFDQYNFSKKLFESKKNIKIIQKDFTDLDFIKYNSDCLFLNNPFKNEYESIEFLQKIISSSKFKKNILIITVNYNKNLIAKLNNIKLLDSYYINEIKGYSILRLNE